MSLAERILLADRTETDPPSQPCVGLEFDGVDDYVEIPKQFNQTPSEFTIIFWANVKKYPTTTWSCFIVKCTNSGLVKNWPFGVVIYRSGQLGFGFGDGANYNYFVSSYRITKGEWHRIVARASSTKIELFVDGMRVGSYGRSIQQPITNDHPIWIARGYSGYLNAIISKLAFYDRALTNDEIKKDMPPNPLFALTFYGSVMDITGNGFDGIIHGNPQTWTCYR